MTTIKIEVTGADARAIVSGTLTAGAAGIPVYVTLDDAWTGLMTRLAVKAGDIVKQTTISETGIAIIPHECMVAEQRLEIGCTGIDTAGYIKVPTVWASCGMVRRSPGSDGLNPPPSDDIIDEILRKAERAEQNADAALKAAEEIPTKVSELENDARYITADDLQESVLQESVKEYLNQHPELLASTWDGLQNKPFDRLGESLKVTDGTLDVNAFEVANASGGNTLIIG